MIIKSLEMVNFKNQQNFKIDFADAVTNVFGANGAGKTTIVDALSFLLWQKDSKGNSDTKMRPYGADGQLLHDIDTTVKGVFEVNGYQFTLEVVYKEKWMKVSGTDERKLTGNTTDFYVDGVPKKAKDYAAFVAEYFMEPWFSLTSNPATFPTLKWQEQRKLLVDLVGDIDNNAVIAEKPELEPILADVEKYGVDDLRAKLLKEKKGYDKVVKDMPIRIDERRKTLSGLEDVEELRKKAELTLVKYSEPLEQLQANRAAIVSGSRKAQIEEQIATIKAKMDAAKAIYREIVAKVEAPFIKKADEIVASAKANAEKVTLLRRQMLAEEKSISDIKERLGKLGETWESVDQEVFADTECPCCHRPYTPDMLQPMLEQFNQSKSSRLEELNKQGSTLSAELKERETGKANLLAEINQLAAYEHDELPKLLAENKKLKEQALVKVPDMEAFVNPETQEAFWMLRESLQCREHELEEARLDVTIQLQNIDKKIEEARKPVDEANKVLARLKLDEETNEVIAQLQAEKKNAMLLVGEVEFRLSLLEKFVVTKMNMLSERINGLFDEVDFKLFETNISNEGIKETCELTMHGVPYRQLSNAEKCRAGMEVVRAISQKINICNPVFIDNRESVTSIGKVPGQIINLYVNPEDRKLRVEHE